MKKLSLLMAAMLLLSACGKVEAPTQANTPAESPSSATESPAATPDQEAPESDASQEESQSIAVNAPMPDSMPQKSGDALELPAALAVNGEWQVELLTPAQYQMEVPLEKGGARGFLSCDVFRAARDGKVTLFNRNGKQISQDGEYDGQPDQGWISTDGQAVPVSKDGLTGLVDIGDGSVLVPLEYTSVSAYPKDFYEVETDGKTTLLLRKSDLSVAYTLERGDRYSSLGDDRDILYQNGTLKIFDKAGTPVKNMVCDDVRVVADNTENVGVNRLAVQENGKWALYDGDGEQITNAVYDDFNSRFRGDYITFRKSNKWGVMDYSGKVTIKPRWDDIILYDSSASLCLDNKWTGTTELDREPEVTHPIYDDVGAFSENGYACFEKNGKYGLLDDAGNVMMTPRQSGRIYAGVQGFDEDVFLVEGDNGPGSFGVLSGGQLVIPTDNIIYSQGINPYYAENEPYNLVYTPSGKWGYIDSQGQYVIDTKFDAADGFIKGRDVAMVTLNGKVCLIDRKGNVVLETVFDDCGGFQPDTMVCSMRYTDGAGNAAYCLVRLIPPAA